MKRKYVGEELALPSIRTQYLLRADDSVKWRERIENPEMCMTIYGKLKSPMYEEKENK